jgi:hypothetical protein
MIRDGASQYRLGLNLCDIECAGGAIQAARLNAASFLAYYFRCRAFKRLDIPVKSSCWFLAKSEVEIRKRAAANASKNSLEIHEVHHSRRHRSSGPQPMLHLLVTD